MRVAVLSDVHGNSPALDAVLEDLARHSIDAVLCLGDHVSGPIDPAGAAERLMGLGALCIQGNHDRWVLDAQGTRAGAVDIFARNLLTPTQIEWLAVQGAEARLGTDIYLCHGAPQGDEIPWLDNFYKGRTTTLPSEAEVTSAAQGLTAAVMLCGHTHVPRTVRLRDGRLIVNPGSVGMQLVRGSPDAHYAILEQRRAGWQTALVAIPYDTEAAARMAEANGFPQWAEAIRFGWAGPEHLF